jgi:hypothetical protein
MLALKKANDAVRRNGVSPGVEKEDFFYFFLDRKPGRGLG